LPSARTSVARPSWVGPAWTPEPARRHTDEGCARPIAGRMGPSAAFAAYRASYVPAATPLGMRPSSACRLSHIGPPWWGRGRRARDEVGAGRRSDRAGCDVGCGRRFSDGTRLPN
jgi:hypothetical protein